MRVWSLKAEKSTDNINEDKLETLDIKTNDKIVDFGKALEQCEYEPYSQWTPHGVVVLEEFYYSGYTAEKISLINGTDKKVLAVEQGKDTFTFLGCGENIAVFADKSHFNAAYSVYSVDYSQSSAGKQVNVAVPYIIGEQYEEFKDCFKFLGFKVNVKEEYSDDDSMSNAGEIPEISESADELAYGSEIHITVSKGFKDREIVVNNMPVMDGKHHITVSFGGYIVDEKFDAKLNGDNYTIKLHPEESEEQMCFKIDNQLVPADNEIEMYIDDKLYYSGHYSFWDADMTDGAYYPLESASPGMDDSEMTASEEIISENESA